MMRSFLPVGQGAFCSEVFSLKDGNHTIIYDCGSSTDRSIVEEQIKCEFSKDEVIDAVFLSHLDEDHINGLPFLLNYCRVKNLFFPLITTRDKIYLKLNVLLSTGIKGFLYEFIEDPYYAFNIIGLRNTPRLYQIRAQGDEAGNNIDAEWVASGSDITGMLCLDQLKKLGWELIPFNFRQKDRIDLLRESLAKEFKCSPDDIDEQMEKLVSDYNSKKEKIRKAYKNISGSFNTNSMTLFSGLRDHNAGQYYAISKQGFCYQCCCSEKNGCLYLGDYDASGKSKWINLKTAYRDYWEYIGCIQIPHHGSSHNYNEAISKMNVINVISAGYNNRYKHPHSSVIKDLILNDCRVHIVTERLGSRVDFKINFF